MHSPPASRWCPSIKIGRRTVVSVFTDNELVFLASRPGLARVATVGADGTPHVVPSGWSYNEEQDSLDISGHELQNTKKFRDVKRTGRAALVIDDLVSKDPWRRRGIEVRGRAEAIHEPALLVRVYPERIVSWGIESDAIGKRLSRRVAA